MPRPLPTDQEAAEILARKRTRPARKPPPPAGRRLGKFIKALDERFGQGAGGLKAHWREIAGESLWRTTEPVKLIKPRGGGDAVLEIRVDGPAAALIQHQAPAILSRVNLFMGEGSAQRLRIIQGPVRPPANAGPPPKRRKPPLDAGAEAQLAASVADADPKLKDALLRLGREVLRGRSANPPPNRPR
jgi:hypothetical protein